MGINEQDDQQSSCQLLFIIHRAMVTEKTVFLVRPAVCSVLLDGALNDCSSQPQQSHTAFGLQEKTVAE